MQVLWKPDEPKLKMHGAPVPLKKYCIQRLFLSMSESGTHEDL